MNSSNINIIIALLIFDETGVNFIPSCYSRSRSQMKPTKLLHYKDYIGIQMHRFH